VMKETSRTCGQVAQSGGASARVHEAAHPSIVGFATSPESNATFFSNLTPN